MAKPQSAERRAINLQILIDFCRSQGQCSNAQQRPDGTGDSPRKRLKKPLLQKALITQEIDATFAKTRTSKFLKIHATGNQIELGFVSQFARMARCQQVGK